MNLRVQKSINSFIKVLTKMGNQCKLNETFKWKNLPVIGALLDKHADVNAKDIYGRTPLHKAAASNNVLGIKILLERGAVLDALDNKRSSALHIAVKYNSVDSLKLLLEAGANVNLKTLFGYTLLHYAARKNNNEMLETLLKKGANVDALNRQKSTALHIVAKRGNESGLKSLLAFGANVNVKDTIGCTPLYYAAKKGNCEMLLSLLKAGTDVEAANRQNLTALHAVCQSGNVSALKLLLLFGANINVKDRFGNTPLHRSAEMSDYEMMKSLVEEGAELDAVNSHNETALSIVAACGDLLCVVLLLEAGASVSERDYLGSTPLNSGIDLGYIKDIEAISFMGGLPVITNTGNLTQLDYTNQHYQLFNLIKLDALNLGFNLKCHFDINCFKDIQKDCLNEVQKLKRKIRGSKKTLYDVVSAREHSDPVVGADEMFDHLINSPKLQEEFPIYASFVKFKYERTKRRYGLLNLATELFSIPIHVPNEVKRGILCYLSNRDLQTVITAFDSHNSGLQAVITNSESVSVYKP